MVRVQQNTLLTSFVGVASPEWHESLALYPAAHDDFGLLHPLLVPGHTCCPDFCKSVALFW